MILLPAAASSAAWTCDATFVVDGQIANPFSIEGTAGCSFEAERVGDNLLMHLIETGSATPAILTIEQPWTDSHSADAVGKFQSMRAGA